jgi:hypothetical protein
MRIMDISELEIPEVPIPTRILEAKARAVKNQRAVISAAKARRRKATTSKTIRRKAS